MYCDADFVRDVDSKGITDELTDSEIENMIEIASRHIDFETKKSFKLNTPPAIKLAVASLVLFLFSSDSLSAAENTKLLQSGTSKIEYFETAIDTLKMPKYVYFLIAPYKKQSGSYIGLA